MDSSINGKAETYLYSILTLLDKFQICIRADEYQHFSPQKTPILGQLRVNKCA